MAKLKEKKFKIISNNKQIYQSKINYFMQKLDYLNTIYIEKIKNKLEKLNNSITSNDSPK